jgi:xanthine dehydrogenase FAD-binding subunit
MKRELSTTVAPTSLEQAVEQLQELGEVTILAGGTDLMPQSHAGRVKFKRDADEHPPHPGAARHHAAKATNPHRRADHHHRDHAHPLVREHLPVLVEAATISPATRSATPARSAATSATPRPPATPWCRCWCSTPRRAGLEARRQALPPQHAAAGVLRRPRQDAVAPASCSPPCASRCPPKGFVARFYKFGTRPALDISAISIGVAGVREGRQALAGARRLRRRGADAGARHAPPRKPWKAKSSTPPPSPPPPRPATRCIPSTTCAPAPGTARK